MKSRTLILFCVIGLAVSTQAQRVETFTVKSPNAGGPTVTNLVNIEENEVATVLLFLGSGGPGLARIYLNKDEIRNVVPGVGWVIAGPAYFEMISHNSSEIGLLTLKIEPESFPPDKTLVVPSGTGANITLEKSTNLINWQSAVPGVYNNTNGGPHLFFRLKAERVQ